MLVEEKGEESEGIWDLDPDAVEKEEHVFSGQPRITSSKSAAFGRGSAFAMEPTRNNPQRRSQPTWSVLPFFLTSTTVRQPPNKKELGVTENTSMIC